METDPRTPGPAPGDATPDPDDAADPRDLAPSTDTPQDPVEDPDADREPGHGKS
jgi:hypothetical protein